LRGAGFAGCGKRPGLNREPEKFSPGAKAPVLFSVLTYGLKPAPFIVSSAIAHYPAGFWLPGGTAEN
jgi:hypothetical protein